MSKNRITSSKFHKKRNTKKGIVKNIKKNFASISDALGFGKKDKKKK